MTDRLTACQNVCQDFSWFGPLLGHLADIATVIAALVAIYAINAWRTNRLRELKQSEAIALLLAARDIEIHVRQALAAISDLGGVALAIIIVKYNSRFLKLAKQADSRMKESAFRIKLLTGKAVSGQEALSDHLLRIESAFLVLEQFGNDRGASQQVDEFLEEQSAVILGRQEMEVNIRAAIDEIYACLAPIVQLNDKKF